MHCLIFLGTHRWLFVQTRPLLFIILAFASWILCCLPSGVFFFGCQSYIWRSNWQTLSGQEKAPWQRSWPFDILTAMFLWDFSGEVRTDSWWCRQRSLDGEVDKEVSMVKSTKVGKNCCRGQQRCILAALQGSGRSWACRGQPSHRWWMPLHPHISHVFALLGSIPL